MIKVESSTYRALQETKNKIAGDTIKGTLIWISPFLELKVSHFIYKTATSQQS